VSFGIAATVRAVRMPNRPERKGVPAAQTPLPARRPRYRPKRRGTEGGRMPFGMPGFGGRRGAVGG
jgi:hypothetical protein